MRLLAIALLASATVFAAAQEKQPDVLTFSNGDRLTGTLERGVGDSVVFKSDMAGELTIPYAKIKTIETHQSFAVIEKGKTITRKTPDSAVPQGVVSLADNTISVTPANASPVQVPVASAAFVVDDPTFQRDLRGSTPFLKGWTGALSLGASLVKATQSDYAANAAVAFVRTIPQADYLAPRNRTTAAGSFDFGEISTPVIVSGARVNQVSKTDIYHAEAERDQYFSSSVYALGRVAYDHNFSQGLQLSQTYGGGLGWTVIRKPKEQLDLKADIHYERENFYLSSLNQNLIGASFGDNYLLKLQHSLVLTQFAIFNPAFNNSNAYSGSAGLNLAAPISKRLALFTAATDNFINNPGFLSPGIPSKKNSIQITTGLTYVLK